MNKLGWALTGAYILTMILMVAFSYYELGEPMTRVFLFAYCIFGIGFNIKFLKDKTQTTGRQEMSEQNQQQNVPEGVSNSDTLKITPTASVDNPQDCSRQTNVVKTDGNNSNVLPGDSKYNEKHDAYYDEEKDIWLEEKCDQKDCEFCSNRPTKPSDCKDS